jgi:hypothetical protein
MRSFLAVTRSGDSQQSLIAVSAFGIFQLNPKNNKMIREVAFFDVVGLSVHPDSVTVIIKDSPDFTFFLSSPIALYHEASHLLNLRLALFDHPHIPFKLTLDPAIETQFATVVIIPLAKYALAPRFAALLMKLPPKALPDASFFDEISRLIRKQPLKFVFTEKIAKLALSRALVLAIAFGHEVRTVEFVAGDFSNFVPAVHDFFLHAESVQTLNFRRVVFTGASAREIVAPGAICAVSEFVFTDCSFADPSAIHFFEAFQQYPDARLICKLHFTDCTFSEAVLDGLFSQCLLYSPCFRGLRSFAISSADNSEFLRNSMIQLATCNWVIVHKNLERICVCDSQIELGGLLPLLFRVDTGVKVLDLSGNRLERRLRPADIRSFWSLRSLRFARCKFGVGALESLLQCLAAGTQGRPFRAKTRPSREPRRKPPLLPHISASNLRTYRP